jgi:hypothetical protein
MTVLIKNPPTDEELNALILRWSVLAGVANITPIIGADVSAVAGCQMKLFFEMAEKYDVHVTKERFREVIITLATGVLKCFPKIILPSLKSASNKDLVGIRAFKSLS